MRTGSCLCGAISFECEEPIGPANYCHCADCRRVTGSAFNIGVKVPREAFTLRGTPRSYTKTADSGREVTRFFCGDCGSPLFTDAARAPDIYYVKAGLLDDPDIPAVSHQSWIESKVWWADIPADLPARTGAGILAREAAGR
jgi:hypothetical protein